MDSLIQTLQIIYLTLVENFLSFNFKQKSIIKIFKFRREMASKVSLLFQKIGSKEFRQQAFTYVKSKEFRGYFMRYFHYFIKYY